MAVRKQRTTETISVSEARQRFSETLNLVHEDNARYIVEKSGIPVAAVVSIDDVRRLQQLDREREERMADLRAVLESTRAAFADIPAEEIEREIEKAVADVKQERRVQRERATDPAR